MRMIPPSHLEDAISIAPAAGRFRKTQVMTNSRIRRTQFLLAAFFLYSCSPQVIQREPSATLCRTEAHFSRRGGAADSVTLALNGAQKTIHVAMYGLTHPGIVDALLAAKSRGVDVALKTDKIES